MCVGIVHFVHCIAMQCVCCCVHLLIILFYLFIYLFIYFFAVTVGTVYLPLLGNSGWYTVHVHYSCSWVHVHYHSLKTVYTRRTEVKVQLSPQMSTHKCQHKRNYRCKLCKNHALLVYGYLFLIFEKSRRFFWTRSPHISVGGKKNRRKSQRKCDVCDVPTRGEWISSETKV